MILIATSLSLLAIVAGMHLLAKTKKEDLGKFFKYVSYFVIVVGFLSIACIGARGIMHCRYGRGHCGMQQGCEGMEDRNCPMGMRKHCREMMGDSLNSTSTQP